MTTKNASAESASSSWEPIPADSKPSRGSLIRVAGESLPLGTVIKIIGGQIKYKTSKNRIAEIALGSELEVKVDGGGGGTMKKGGGKAASPAKATKPGPLDDYDARMAAKGEGTKEEEEEENPQPEPIEEPDVNNRGVETAEPAKPKPTGKSLPKSTSAWYSIEQVASFANIPATRVAKLNREGHFEGLTQQDTDAKGPGRKPLLYSSAVLDIIAALPAPTRGKPGRKPGSGKSEKGESNVQQTSIRFDQDDAKKRAAEERAKAKKISASKESSAVAPSNGGGLGAILFHLDATILETRMQINRLHAALEGLEAQRGVLVSIAE